MVMLLLPGFVSYPSPLTDLNYLRITNNNVSSKSGLQCKHTVSSQWIISFDKQYSLSSVLPFFVIENEHQDPYPLIGTQSHSESKEEPFYFLSLTVRWNLNSLQILITEEGRVRFKHSGLWCGQRRGCYRVHGTNQCLRCSVSLYKQLSVVSKQF